MSKIAKSFKAGAFENVVGKPSEEDYVLIKKHMVDNVDINDLFVYKVKLCDNRIDRTMEQFTSKALDSITKLYIGKPGIEDHEAKSENMHSRVYKTEHIKEEGGYEYVIAYCYTLNNDKNKGIVDEIRAGIKKEVSVGLECETICSICGKNINKCGHKKGKRYTVDGEEKPCIGLLDEVTDTYEYSFVAIPCQPKAGVVKQYRNNEGEESMKAKSLVLKLASTGVSNDVVKELLDALDEIEKPESEVVKSLNAQITKLEGEVKNKGLEIDKLIKARKAEKKKSIISGIVKEFDPVNEKMEDLAESLIEDLVDVDDEGNVTGEDEAKDLLGAEEYKPLFKEAGDTEEDVEKELDVEEKEEPVAKSKPVSKSIGFTKNRLVEPTVVKAVVGRKIKEVE